jgi:hypothetical protein
MLYFWRQVRAIGWLYRSIKADDTEFGDLKEKGKISIDAKNEIRPLRFWPTLNLE